MQRFDETWIEPWCGAGADVDAARAALSTLDEALRGGWGTPLYKSPGLTGALAWRKTTGREWEPIAPELQQLIRDTSGQGRFELCPAPDLTELSALYCLDLRLAYAASAIAMTSGRTWWHEVRPAGGWGVNCERRFGAEGFFGFTPGRYRVRFRVPEHWAHVGLMPYRCGDRWTWPDTGHWMCADGEETWADAAEVRLALSQGWNVEVLERLICVDTDVAERRPLRRWAERLLALRDDLCKQSAAPELYRTAIRNLILQTIGVFAARPRVETRTVASRDELPTHDLAEESFRELEDGRIEYEDFVSNPAAAGLRHPEFSAAIWADTRVRLLRQRSVIGGQPSISGALAMPREQVIGFGLDCIYATDDPLWPDDGKPGRYRVKWSVPGPLPVPANRRELEGLAPDG